MRLAFCGNVFPAESAAEARAVFDGPLPALRARLGDGADDFGFGLYLAAPAVRELQADADLRADWLRAARASGWPIWTANAFPFGGFHGDRVKERAFAPDWRTPERLAFTTGVADLLAELLPAGESGSLSSCPLGYGPDARHDPASARHLRAAGAALDRIADEQGVSLTLALEPEPDGACERVPELAAWLRAEVDHPRVGVCWDLCHSAVVGESADDVLDALRATGVPLGKVQVSAALQTAAGFGAAARGLFEVLAGDRYFHQVRGLDGAGRARAWRDLPALLADPDWPEGLGLADGAGALRVHCHVPLHRARFASGLVGTDWRSMFHAARAAGCRDFELETYTLPVLPAALRGSADEAADGAAGDDVLDVLAAEFRAVRAEAALDTAAGRP